MKDTIHFILIILSTFLFPVLTSLLFDIDWFMRHWLRQAMVILFVLLQLAVGILVFMSKANLLKKRK